MHNLAPATEVQDVPSKEVWVNASEPSPKTPELWLDLDATPAMDFAVEIEALKERVAELEHLVSRVVSR